MAAKVGGIVLENVHNVSENGGMNAPEKKTEKGFSYASHVGSEPIEASFDAWVTPRKYDSLTSLRDSQEPFKATVGLVSLGSCKLNNLKVNQDADQYSHYSITVSVQQVFESETGEATLSVESGEGDEKDTKSGSSEGLDPTLVRSGEEEGADTGPDPLGDVANWLGF